MAYRIKDWSIHFENHKSREITRCSYVCMPNKQDGLGLARILALPDGAAVFGVWCLILQACSRQRGSKTEPRDGWMTDDGRRAGAPWAAADLALRWRRPIAEIERALEVLTNRNVGWVEEMEQSAAVVSPECRPSVAAAPSGCPSGTLEEREGTEQEGEEGGPAAASSLSAREVRERELLAQRGFRLEFKGKDLMPEWVTTLRGLLPPEIDAILADYHDAVTLPSHFANARRQYQERHPEAPTEPSPEAVARAVEERAVRDQAAREASERKQRIMAEDAACLPRIARLVAALDANPDMVSSERQRALALALRQAKASGRGGSFVLLMALSAIPALAEIDAQQGVA